MLRRGAADVNGFRTEWPEDAPGPLLDVQPRRARRRGAARRRLCEALARGAPLSHTRPRRGARVAAVLPARFAAARARRARLAGRLARRPALLHAHGSARAAARPRPG